VQQLNGVQTLNGLGADRDDLVQRKVERVRLVQALMLAVG